MPNAPRKHDEQIQETLLRVFQENVRIMRDDLGISQSELARRIGRSPGYVCDIEHGRRKPNLTTVALFAEALGVNASLLLSTAMATHRIDSPSLIVSSRSPRPPSAE